MTASPRRKYKIVRVIGRLNVGGPARHVVWLTEALFNEEFDSVLIAGIPPEGEEDMSYFAARHGVEPTYIAEMSRELSAKDAVSLWKVYREFKRQQPDLVHTHTAKAGTVGRVAGFFYRWATWKTLIGKPRPVKFVHTYHGHVFHSYYGLAKTRFFLIIEKTLALLATDKIIVISNQQHDEIHNRFGVGSSKQFKVVPLGIDLSSFENADEKRGIFRRELNAQDDEILVGLVGRLTEIKNHSLFLKVAELYKNNRTGASPKLRFVVIGGGHLREELEARAKELQIEDLVDFVGNRNDADVFYAGLDIVALTSHNEGTPLSLIEAMANERAVVSTAVGGVVDLLGAAGEETNGYTVCERGVRVAPGDDESFYAGLIRLAKDEKLRRDMSGRGRDFAYSSYSKERLIRDIKELYRDLLREKS